MRVFLHTIFIHALVALLVTLLWGPVNGKLWEIGRSAQHS
jgi:hypothetical protein